jgi:hypothetical protein
LSSFLHESFREGTGPAAWSLSIEAIDLGPERQRQLQFSRQNPEEEGTAHTEVGGDGESADNQS